MARRSMKCACCGAAAGTWEQWPNRDTGYGLCASCVPWLSARMSPEELRADYGIAGVHYEAPPPAPPAEGENKATTQQPDTKPGFYYVTVVDGARVGALLGPFVNDHAAALALVDAARAKACELNARAHFYAFGTVRSDTDRGPGSLNRLIPEAIGRPL